MEYQAIVIDKKEKGDEMTNSQGKRGMTSLPNGASSSLTKTETRLHVRPVEESDEDGRASETLSCSSFIGGEDKDELPIPPTEHEKYMFLQTSSEEQEKQKLRDALSLKLIQRRLEERQGRRFLSRLGQGTAFASIFRLPQSLLGVDQKAQHPEVVSIGPYHRGKDHLIAFEDHKWSFLEKLLSRTRESLSVCLEKMREMEQATRECYADTVIMSGHDFVEMMLLDGCFVIELLRHLGQSEDVIEEDDPIFTRPWLIPLLIRDLLKLENQLPFFVLEMLFVWSKRDNDPKPDDLPLLALKVFDLACPRPLEIIDRCRYLRSVHLLDLFRLSLLPACQVTYYGDVDEYRPSDQSIPCVTQLRPSGIKFKARKAESFLDINFRNRVLEIPSVTINDFTSTILINCVAWEQCQESSSKYVSDYVSFMNCLINQPRDVAFLCSDGIITRCSQDDQYVANLFNNLGKNTVFSIRKCSLSKQFRQVEAYYSSNWAIMMRTYFSSPWSFISVFSAFILIVLTMIQTIMSVLSYNCQSK